MGNPTSFKEFITDIDSNGGFIDLEGLWKVFKFNTIANAPTFFLAKIFTNQSTEENYTKAANGFAKDHLSKLSTLLMKYGLKQPIIPDIYYNESSVEYLLRVWRANAQNIIPIRSLSYSDRGLLMGPTLANLSWVQAWHEKAENSVRWNNGWFSKLPYNDRKFLVFVKDYSDYEKKTPNIQRFRISHIPSDIKIEPGVPEIGKLYIAHPYRVGMYLPALEYEHLLLRERIHELSTVMQALGATEIKTLHNSGYCSQSSSERSSKTSGSYEGSFRGSGTYASHSTQGERTEKDDAIVINFKNDPYRKPYIPEGLVWYPHNREWQQIAENRLNGNLLEYEIRISSKEVNLISASERSLIEGEVKILLASGRFSHSSSTQSFFKEESAKSTSILVKFKSRKDY